MAGNSHGEHDVEVPDFNRPEVRHEESDVNAWDVARFALGLMGLMAVALLLLAGLFKYFQSRDAQTTAPAAGVAVDARKLPPMPRLQDTPVLDLQSMRAAEDQILNSYGWVDPQKGVVRIPIDRAIDLLAQRGLPARAQAPPTTDVSVPTESSLGPKVQQPGGPLAGVLK